MFRCALLNVRWRYFSTVHPLNCSADRGELRVKELRHTTKVPQKPHEGGYSAATGSPLAKRIQIDDQTVQLLERLSLVDLSSGLALQTLQDSVEFAARILPIDTEGVPPLYSVLEHETLALRVDVVDDGNLQEDVLRNATVTEEEYFVAPPGNIPLEQTDQA